jgi:carbamoyltransferase
MLICGVKLSHDGGIALIDGNRLAFNVEVEKLDNNYRYSSLGYLERVTAILASENVQLSEVDALVVDGWWTESGDASPLIRTVANGGPITIEVAPYTDEGNVRPSLTRHQFATSAFGSIGSYASYHHATGHLLASYCSSPFAKRGEDALILVWDGGMVPRLYEVSGRRKTVRLVRLLMPVVGNIFADFARCFDPFTADTTGWDAERDLRYDLGIAGKAMAFTALGKVVEELSDYIGKAFTSMRGISVDNAEEIARRVIKDRAQIFPELTNADLIATLQAYLGDRLLASLRQTLARYYPGQVPNLGMAGGCALNIKWNKLIRDSGMFREVWIPPFPNDSGASIGAAVSEMFTIGGDPALDWDVYSGPSLRPTLSVPHGWTRRLCTEAEVAAILHAEGEPVVVVSGRAELGPRALGNRSILAPATDATMKDFLNEIKCREQYRPVAPICLESEAAQVFYPGIPDHYMLFEHGVRHAWKSRIPAVIHLDGTARLQTIRPDAGAGGRILAAYARLSGIPVLCNTSANFNGRGFFPDAESAMRWGKTKYVWSDGELYVNQHIRRRGDTN